MAYQWHLNISLLHPETLFVLGHLFLLLHLNPLLLMSDSMMRRPNWTSWRTFHDAAFIWNAKSSCQTFLALTYPLLSKVGVKSHFVASRSCALPWSYRTSTPICTDIHQFSTRVQGIRMVVTPNIVSEVLHIPRVVHLNYPSSKR